MGAKTSGSDAVAPPPAIDAFWRAANYLSASLLYLRSNATLRRPLELSDLKPRAVGHWGCAPSLNFLWANLLYAIQATGADVRLFLGTGHAGASWLACTSLEGSLGRYYGLRDDEPGLNELVSAFGRTGGFPTELSSRYPGVLWPSGELGHALGIAQGHALSARDAVTVAILGDGELETAPTSAAFDAVRKLRARTPRLSVIVNLNGFRMGGPSEISAWTTDEIAGRFAPLGLSPKFIEGFDAAALAAALVSALSDPEEHNDRMPLILFRTPKGATLPPSPMGEDLVGTHRAHKAPVKKLRGPEDVAWLEAWLRSYGPEHIFSGGRLDRSSFAAIVPPDPLLIGAVRSRIAPPHQPSSEIRAPASTRPTHVTSTDAFVATVRSLAENTSAGLLLTSPDELTSNRLDAITASSDIELVEYLSEQLCVSWAVGAVTAGRSSWYATYDAFAPIVTSTVTQYLKFLDDALEARVVQVSHPPLNILLTSLGWRNVYSHQDPGFASSLLEKRFSSFRCFLPATPASMAAAVEACHRLPNSVNCVIADKYPPRWTPPITGLPTGEPFTLLGTWGDTSHAAYRVIIVVAGDYLVREAVYAAEAVALAASQIAAQVVVLEELTWLYRSSPDCDFQRAQFANVVQGSQSVQLVTSLYDDILFALVRRLLPQEMKLTSRGFRSHATSATPVGLLLESGSTWLQLAQEALAQGLRDATGGESAMMRTALRNLRATEYKLRDELARAYDEPQWYWDLLAASVMGGNRGEEDGDL